MEKLLVELQDENGNIYYLHTDGRVVFCSDGESVESKLNKKVNAADIINNCTSTATNKPLAAAQGKSLWDRITTVITSLTNHQSSTDHDGRYYTETEINTKLGTKLTSSGGDAADAKVSGFTANNTSFPVPAAGQTFRVMWGIMAKFCNDVKSSCFLISNIVNNCTSTATNKALSAAQGKALWDKYTQLNSDKHNKIKSRAFNPTYNTTNLEAAGTTSVIWVRQWGAVVHVHFYIKLKPACNKPYTSYQIATRLPPSLYSAQSGALSIDGEKADDYIEISDSGVMTLFARFTNMAGKIAVGGFTYIAKNDTW